MDKYDYRTLLQRFIKEISSLEGMSDTLFKDVKDALKKDKPNLSSVFGVGLSEEQDGALCVFASDAATWKDEGCCADYYKDDAYKVLTEIGLIELCDGVFSYSFDIEESKNFMSREDIIDKLTLIGFEYDKRFEDYMLDF